MTAMRSGHLFDTEPKGLEGFNDVYALEIAPYLSAMENRRRKTHANANRTFIGLLLFILTGVFVLLTVLGGVGIPIAFVGSIALIVLLHKHVYATHGDAKRAHKSLVVGKIAEYLGLEYWEGGFLAMVRDHSAVGILPDFDRGNSEDGFSGSSKEIPFRLTEVRLEKEEKRKKASIWRTVFRGVLVSIDVAKPFAGETILLRNKADLFSMARERFGNASLVTLESPEFAERFTVLSTDQVEARFLLTPSTMGRLLDLEANHDQLVAAFSGGKLHLAFKQEDRFEAGGPNDDLTDPELVRSALADLVAVRDLAGALSEISAARV